MIVAFVALFLVTLALAALVWKLAADQQRLLSQITRQMDRENGSLPTGPQIAPHLYDQVSGVPEASRGPQPVFPLDNPHPDPAMRSTGQLGANPLIPEPPDPYLITEPADPDDFEDPIALDKPWDRMPYDTPITFTEPTETPGRTRVVSIRPGENPFADLGLPSVNGNGDHATDA